MSRRNFFFKKGSFFLTLSDFEWKVSDVGKNFEAGLAKLPFTCPEKHFGNNFFLKKLQYNGKWPQGCQIAFCLFRRLFWSFFGKSIVLQIFRKFSKTKIWNFGGKISLGLSELPPMDYFDGKCFLRKLWISSFLRTLKKIGNLAKH